MLLIYSINSIRNMYTYGNVATRMKIMCYTSNDYLVEHQRRQLYEMWGDVGRPDGIGISISVRISIIDVELMHTFLCIQTCYRR